MKSSPACPHCQVEVNIAKLRHQGLFKSYRICPNCDGAFQVDPKTKQRQFIFIILALISLALTILLYFKGNYWLIPACISYIILAALIYWANKQVYFVPIKLDNSE